MNSTTRSPQQIDAVVIGAGFSGLYQVYKLREQGMTVQGIEQAPEVGGTWYWNRYPGARTDSPSHVYQYWFSEELLEEWDWQERYPGQQETEKYLNLVADKFDLRRHFQLDTQVLSAHWLEAEKLWQITTDQGETLHAKFLISCCGAVSVPLKPIFTGMEDFQGQIVHTSQWPKEGVDLKGKRVGVVGTGATGIQVVQTIAPDVAELTVFQRTANYAVPIKNPDLSDADRAALRERYPEIHKFVQQTFAGFDADVDTRSYHDVPKAERDELLETLWNDGSLKFWVGSFQEIFLDADVNAEISEFVRERIRARIDDPAVAEKLIPTAHGFGTRRVPLENGYFEVFNREHVALVDLREEPIESVTTTGVRTANREYPLDVLIMATGFNAGVGALTRIDVRGRAGESLGELWSRDIRATLGLQVHGYPNLFMTSAPLAPSSGFCNAPTCIQQQVEWITRCIAHVRDFPNQVIEPTAEKEAEWVAHHDELANMTLVSKTDSWYTGANVEGKPNRLISYIGGVGAYRDYCDEVEANGYEGFAIA